MANFLKKNFTSSCRLTSIFTKKNYALWRNMASRPRHTKFLPLTDSSRSEELKEPKKNFLKCVALDRFSKRVFLAFFNAIWLFLWQSHFFFRSAKRAWPNDSFGTPCGLVKSQEPTQIWHNHVVSKSTTFSIFFILAPNFPGRARGKIFCK